MPAEGLWSILTPVIVAALILVVGSFTSRRWAPAQAQTLQALQVRISTLEAERDDCRATMAALAVEVTALRTSVARLTADNYDLLRSAAH